MFAWPKPIMDWILWVLIFVCPLLALLLFGSGCEGGLPLMAQANPQTTVEINPLTKQLRIFSNDGRAGSIKDLDLNWATKDGATGQLKIGEFQMTERSVENRGANADQIRAGAEQITALTNGVANVIGAATTPLIGAKYNLSGSSPIGEAQSEVELGGHVYVPILTTPTAPDAPPAVIMVPKEPTTQSAH